MDEKNRNETSLRGLKNLSLINIALGKQKKK